MSQNILKNDSRPPTGGHLEVSCTIFGKNSTLYNNAMEYCEVVLIQFYNACGIYKLFMKPR